MVTVLSSHPLCGGQGNILPTCLQSTVLCVFCSQTVKCEKVGQMTVLGNQKDAPKFPGSQHTADSGVAAVWLA